MPLQDLTPQLRTRLSQMERAVGLFVMVGTLLLLIGFGYYLYKVAQARGWFAVKARFYTYANSGAGLQVGDEVKLVGFTAGKITDIHVTPARGKDSKENVYVEFVVQGDNYKYLWAESSAARFDDAGFLGKRELDLTRGTGSNYTIYVPYTVRLRDLEQLKSSGVPTNERLGQEIYEGTNLVARAWMSVQSNLDNIEKSGLSKVWVIDRSHADSSLTSVWNEKEHHYEPFEGTNIYYLPPDEPPSLSDRIGIMVAQVQAALPGVLQLTNEIAATLSNTMHLTSNLNLVAAEAHTSLTNLSIITAQLRDPHGSLGEWLIPTNINHKLDLTLGSANGTLTNVDVTLTNVDSNLVSLNKTLDNLADITSNLNDQVQANSNILSNVSSTVVHSDEFIQGLKRFWLFRHTFKTNSTPAAAEKSNRAVVWPKD